LRIPAGPAIGRGQEHEVWVLEPDQAKAVSIRTGLKAGDYVEVIGGLKEGDRVVLSEIASPEDLENLENH
jgi:HlyD family secretion protein